MIDIPGRYEASFFADIGDIRPNADSIPVFLEMFRKEGWLPNTFQEIALGIIPAIRLRLASPDNEWVIDFDSNRVIFVKNPTKPKGSNLGTPIRLMTQ